MNNIRSLWHRLTEPSSTDEVEARREHRTKIILVMVAVSLFLLSLPILIGWGVGAFDTEGVVRILCMDLVIGVGLVLAQRGHWRLGGYVPPAVFLVQALYGTYAFGLESQVALYLLTILLIAMLQGTRAQWVMLPVIVGAYLGTGWLHGDRDPELYAVSALSISGVLVGVALLQWLSTTQLERALTSARFAAAELKEYRNHLEEIVRERTLALAAANEELQREIAERLRAEEALQRANDELETHVQERTAGLAMANEQLEREFAERKHAEDELRRSEERYRQLVNYAPAGIYEMDLVNARFLSVNDIMCEYTGYTRTEFLALNPFDILSEDSKQRFRERQSKALAGAQVPETVEYKIRGKNNREFWVILNMRLIYEGERATTAAVVIHDISERKRAEQLLQALNRASLAAEQALTPDEIFATLGQEFRELGFSCALFLIDENQSRLFPTYMNHEAKILSTLERLAGIERKKYSIPIEAVDLYQQVVWGKRTIFLADVEEVSRQWLPPSLAGLAQQMAQMLQVSKSIAAPLVVEDQVIGVLSVQSNDLTENDVPAITAFAHQMAAAWRKAQLMTDLENNLEELKRTQAQLVQAQKMEAIGRLAGGVAHDFNNLLTIVDLNAQLLERKLYPQDPLWEHVQQIREAGERASRLTGQLLSFSRREVIEPQVIDLSRAVDNLSWMLRRVTGESIQVITALARDLQPIKVDPSQIEQVIINLTLNARDAMPQGGRLSIETANCAISATDAAERLNVQPGEYVVLAVSDTGIGMDDNVKAHIFEPFFTTKEQGQGTGLGLPTVYGIVKQNAGHIWVHSEVGKGTTFRIYLPAASEDEMPEERPLRAPPPSAVRGSETILVVEDEPSVRALAVRILQSHGYEALAAADGPEALRISQKHHRPIDLLLTDVVMPEMNGKELAEQLRREQPDMRVVFMSGYGEDVIAHHGVLNEGTTLLPKPFNLDTLTQKVRAILDAR
jgi:two-component system cell cycle sensor histidine kinase/response regulator CckA